MGFRRRFQCFFCYSSLQKVEPASQNSTPRAALSLKSFTTFFFVFDRREDVLHGFFCTLWKPWAFLDQGHLLPFNLNRKFRFRPGSGVIDDDGASTRWAPSHNSQHSRAQPSKEDFWRLPLRWGASLDESCHGWTKEATRDTTGHKRQLSYTWTPPPPPNPSVCVCVRSNGCLLMQWLTGRLHLFYCLALLAAATLLSVWLKEGKKVDGWMDGWMHRGSSLKLKGMSLRTNRRECIEGKERWRPTVISGLRPLCVLQCTSRATPTANIW